MPFEIVRNDITEMQVDAVVNTANPRPVIGAGVDAGIHKKTGPLLLAARKRIGNMRAGEVRITPAFDMDADYVIHSVGPIWEGGNHNETRLLARCYSYALRLAKENGCESIALPLLASGNNGFPKSLALQIAIHEISRFLIEEEMYVYLVVFNREAYELSEKLFTRVASYIDEKYIRDKTADEYDDYDLEYRIRERRQMERVHEEVEFMCKSAVCKAEESSGVGYSMLDEAASARSLEDELRKLDAGFSETLIELIKRSGQKDSDVYKKANVDRKLFSKIKNNPAYHPKKETALAFAVALELDLADTKDFIGRAGYALSHSSVFDIIVEFYIESGNYDIFELNEVLFGFDQNLLGAS